MKHIKAPLYPALLAGILMLFSALQPALAQEQWEEAIQAFEQMDETNPPPEGAILFAGSSSIRLWSTLAEDFPDARVINRGFGGSQMSDLIHFADRIVTPYAPRLILVYEGDNDVAAGKTAEQVFADYQQFVSLVHDQLSDTRIAFIAIKPSLARRSLMDEMRKANGLIEEYAAARDHLDYIDIFTPMLGEDGEPLPDIFVDDGLHLNAAGYAIWAEVVRPYLAR
ncbi:MAG: hypothetical protein F4Y00_02855 [Bacteroidetes bacterium SB0662_bin_6]|nr:hypothetical protein [Bacteroidetes bacterium SB0668_bin_1]MYE03900.1 hypothetical protein [Bacteroidetes bacterium SB0662_bin_6]